MFSYLYLVNPHLKMGVASALRCIALNFPHDFNTTRLTGPTLQPYNFQFPDSYIQLQDLKLEHQLRSCFFLSSQKLLFGTLNQFLLSFDLIFLHLLLKIYPCLLSLDFSGSRSCLQGHRSMQCPIKLQVLTHLLRNHRTI